jgi:hypothetical protein
MTTTSNAYAEKVFAEHPVSLWSLDDETYYVSLLNETKRNLSTWTETGIESVDSFANQEAIEVFEFSNLPFPNSYINAVTVSDAIIDETLTATLTSDSSFQPTDFNPNIKNFSVGTYLFPYARAIQFTVGITYLDATSTTVNINKTFNISKVSQWAYVSEMFDLPEEFSNMKIVFKITYTGATTDYVVLTNGLSVGQLSEQFNVESLGSTLVDVNSQVDYSVFNSNVFGVRSESYGLQSLSGYYLANPYGTLCAINSGMPMVYGATSSTQITPNTTIDGEPLPSIIFPGLGFLNDEGQHKDLTFEFWIRVQSKTDVLRKIFGPLFSDDGIYVKDSFLILKLGSNTGTYYINEWERPMLIAIRYSDELVSLVLNGEEIISINILGDVPDFPSKFNTVEGVVYDQDWLGFYAYTDVPVLEIDCVGIYPYIVPSIMEKRRWIYGQAVGSPTGLSSSELSVAVSTDYTVANYAKNYSYPDMGRWQQGINENLLIDNQSIKLPEYSLPEIMFDNKTIGQWYEDVPLIDQTFGPSICLTPNSDDANYDWSTTNGYIYFSSLALTNQDIKAFYGIFESDTLNTDKQILFVLENELTKDILEISLTENTINYNLRYLQSNGEMSDDLLIYTNNQHIPGEFLFVGIEINKFIAEFGGKLASIFGSKKQLKVYVGGFKNFENTFTGKIYRIGFCTARNLQKISNAFTSQGVAVAYNALENVSVYDAEGFVGNSSTTTNYSSAPTLDGGDSYFESDSEIFEQVLDGGAVYSFLIEEILAHTASYTLVPKLVFDKYVLDIAVNGYWQDYIPLSHFGKYVVGGNNQKQYGVDFIQYNISYPAIHKFINKQYDVSTSVIRTYVSFDYLKNKTTIDPGYFSYVVNADKNNIVEPDENWYKRLYSITDNTIIYLPPNIDINSVSLVLHIEVISDGISTSPINVQSLQLSSQALNTFNSNLIGTKYGSDIFPYRKVGSYFDYKIRNPLSVYKQSMPYLYLTHNSGFRLHESSIVGERGISVPINKNSAEYYKLSGIQLNAKYINQDFPNGIIELMQIQSNDQFIRVYMEKDAETAQRAKIYVIDANTGIPYSDIAIYINGHKTRTPVININVWHTIGLIFEVPVDFSGQPGAIRLTGPLLWNNLFQYQASQAVEDSQSVYRKWSGIKTVNSVDRDWTYWKTLTPPPIFTWRDALFVSSENLNVLNGKTIYEKFTGSNRIIINTDNIFRINNYQYNFYNDIVWQTYNVSPV